jgi:hypothetical protein
MLTGRNGKAAKKRYSSRSMARTICWMSSGRASSSVAQEWPQLGHVTVMTEMLFTTSVQPVYWHLGQGIRSGRSVLGTWGRSLLGALSESGAGSFVKKTAQSVAPMKKSPSARPSFRATPEIRLVVEGSRRQRSLDAKTGARMSRMRQCGCP